MKRLMIIIYTALLSAALCITVVVAKINESQRLMLGALIAASVISVILLAECIFFTVSFAKKKKSAGSRRKLKPTRKAVIGIGYIATAVTLCVCMLCVMANPQLLNKPDNTVSSSLASSTASNNSSSVDTPIIEIPNGNLGSVGSVDESDPDNWSVKWEIIKNKALTTSFEREDEISFGNPNKTSYFSLPGIATFRGDNYRTGAVYGTADLTNKTLTQIWEKKTGSLSRTDGGAWTGSGWTGQPLMVQWDEDTKNIMNLYPEKKSKKDLVEVIYATMDGKIYFYDLSDGSYTRDPLNMGMAFKGAGALDPRGYPIMYVGSGDKTVGGKYPRMFIINLIDCSIMYERGHSESFNLRPWRAFDSSPLVHAETDTLIWPGENGLLYTIKLNTKYDKSAGTLSIDPDEPVMTRYKTSYGGTLGYESSAVIVENYIYVADNSGMLFCVDINTMKLKWAQKVYDDTNATPVFSWENGKGYLYTGCSTERLGDKCYIAKLDASTGAKVWEKCFDGVVYDKMVSGGVLGSPVLGKYGTNLEGLVIYPIAKINGYSKGLLVALDTETGDVVWEETMSRYSWSSPVALYDGKGEGYIILCDSGGNVKFINGKTGETLNSINLGSNIEASPAVFNDILVIGTRGQKVYGVKIG